MLNPIKKIHKSDWLVILFYWLVAYVYIVPAYFFKGQILETFLLSLIEIAARTFLAIMTVYQLFPKKNDFKSILFALLKATLIILLLTPFFMIGDGYYNKVEVDWSFSSIAKNLLSEAQEIGILCAILSMKKYYYIQNYTQQLEKLNVENQLRSLNNQVSPHFLFNNLNVLSGLISQNPILAKEYVNRLALIYRHLTANIQNDVVFLKEELKFADDYIYLLNQRFENAYQFNIEPNNYSLNNKLLPTCSLQLVLENIIKHNKGDNHNPLKTLIKIFETEIHIINQKNLKEQDEEKSGFGLNNLIKRYEILSDKQLEVITTDKTFTIKLPLLNVIN